MGSVLNPLMTDRNTSKIGESHKTNKTPSTDLGHYLLANVYLHYALDLWFERVVKPHCRGEALLCRYADDWVCAFRYKGDATRFYTVLPKRLQKFNVQVEPSKTQMLRFSRFHPGMERRFSF